MLRFAGLKAGLLILAPALILLLTGCNGSTTSEDFGETPPGPPPMLALANFVTGGLNNPIGFEVPPDGSGRIFIVEQAGTIRFFQQNGTLIGTFLDISSKIACCGERGLLGLAFHPQFSTNGQFYVNYTNIPDGQSVIAEYEVSSADPNQADVAERQLLIVDQPFANHNGGQLAFGPDDNALYIALGDGGGDGGGLGGGNGQSTGNLLGKILRIGVDGNPYTIPSDNPFVGVGGARVGGGGGGESGPTA